MDGIKWQMERFCYNTRKWEPIGEETSDFHRLWTDSEEMANKGVKVRIVKIGKMMREEEYFGPETPETGSVRKGESRG